MVGRNEQSRRGLGALLLLLYRAFDCPCPRLQLRKPSTPCPDNAADLPEAGQVLSLEVTEPLLSNPTSDGFPASFYVDWIRVWQRNATTTPRAPQVLSFP